MDVSVIIVNYNTRQLTAECIDSVFEKTSGIDFEIILVDNASTDGSLEQFSADSRIHYIYNKENVGFGRANNIGYARSSGRYVLFLNSDTILENNAVEILARFLDLHPEAAMTGGQLLDRELKPAFSYYHLFPSALWELNFLMKQALTKSIDFFKRRSAARNGFCSVAYIIGADLMVRRSDIERLGLFDPKFFMYFEETEMARRYAAAGRKSLFCPEARIIHLENASFRSAGKKDRMFYRSRRLYYESIFPKWKCRLADSLLKFTCRVRIAMLSGNPALRDYWRNALMIIREVEKE